jgi:hypothetical protein
VTNGRGLLLLPTHAPLTGTISAVKSPCSRARAALVCESAENSSWSCYPRHNRSVKPSPPTLPSAVRPTNLPADVEALGQVVAGDAHGDGAVLGQLRVAHALPVHLPTRASRLLRLFFSEPKGAVGGLTSGTEEDMSVPLMDSIPPAMPRGYMPDWIPAATLMNAWSPDEHCARAKPG